MKPRLPPTMAGLVAAAVASAGPVETRTRREMEQEVLGRFD